MIILITFSRPAPMPPDPRSFLPLRAPELVLLLALVDGERHGYALAQELSDRTDGLVTLEPGNLYRVLRRLMSDGLVDESERRPAPDLDDERRRYYRATPLGARVAAAELERLRALVASPVARALVQRWRTT
jgi:DNA-binding PadR family transcriptional regulator